MKLFCVLINLKVTMILINIYQRYNEYLMRGSPINHIRRSRQEDTSPFRSSAQRQPYSPERVLAERDIDYWRHLARKFQTQNITLNQQIVAARRYASVSQQLEDRIEVLLAQNSHLADENENFLNIIQKKNSQIEIWRSKYQGQQSSGLNAQNDRKKALDQLNIQDRQYQNQIDRLIQQNSNLHIQLQDLENLKAIQISALKSKCQNETMNEIQNLKRSQYGNQELQQLKIRQLKDKVEEKEFENQNIRREAKLDNQRLNGEINYLKNEIKKLEHQNQHELNLLRTQNENNRNNLLRTHRKNEEQLKSLYDTKIKRLNYDIQEKKNQIQDYQGKIKKGGKENEFELNQIANEKSKLRQQIKQSDNNNLRRVNELTSFYESQLAHLRENSLKRQSNLIQLYDNQIASLRAVIEAKQQQIQRMLGLNSQLKINQENRLNAIKMNNDQLKQKIQEIVTHYERQIELMKIKVAQLYEADLESLRSNMQNRFSAHSRERENLIDLLRQTQSKLSRTVQDKIDLRKQYQIRLDQYKIKYEREHQQLQDLLALQEKQFENQTSKVSMSHITHNNSLEEQALNRKQLEIEKRELQKQIQYKNKEIEALNTRIQLMEGYSKRQSQKLSQEITKLKQEHDKYVGNQDKQTQQWGIQRSQFKEKIHVLDLKIQQVQNGKKEAEQKLQKQIESLRLKIAQKDGQIEQLHSKCGVLDTKHRVQASNVQKTQIESQSLMNSQRTKFLQSKQKEIRLKDEQFTLAKKELEAQIEDLRKENEILRDTNDKARIRQAELVVENTNLLDSVNKRNALEEHVINIGLSNNYFKNVSQIFKKRLQPEPTSS